MKAICLHDRLPIERFLRRNTYLHLYAIGDLDDRFWPFTTWYALADGQVVRAIALMYTGLSLPTLLALGDEELPVLRQLVACLIPLLPRRFYAHLSPGLCEVLAEAYAVTSHGETFKMALTAPERLAPADGSAARPLSERDLDALAELYEPSYPGHFFEPAMMQTGRHFGMWDSGELISAAGTHVFSGRHRVAALGNIATHADHRGRGHARTVVSALCRAMLPDVDHIGLNVHADNEAAVRCYRSVGFEVIASYEECVAELRR